jgi:deoxyadenosine/deoxycytidine kinase
MINAGHIVIAGNIGVGKSTLVGLLHESMGWTPVYELDEAHPYLTDYYVDPPRWGFHSQIWFLTSRLRQHQQIAALPGCVVQDRSIYEDAAVFAASLHEQGILSGRDYATYRQLYAAIAQELRPPSLVVYLRARVDTLLARIAGRARPAEEGIRAEYLASLERHYETWIAGWAACPVLTVETDDLDVVRDEAARRALIGHVARQSSWEAF